MRMLRVVPVCERTGLQKRMVYRLIAEGKFPRPVQISARSVAWPENEIDEWVKARIAERDKVAA